MTPIYIADYNYPLTEDRIAKYPIAERDQSKLLIYRNGDIAESKFYHIPEIIPANTLLVRNNTRVIQARMIFHKQSGARIEIFCLEPHRPADYQISLSSTEPVVWNCLVGNLKKWRGGELKIQLSETLTLTAEKLENLGNTVNIRFSWSNHSISFVEILQLAGELPIPPYLNRETQESDKVTYQTVYAKIDGSVAAPTAGLHFTDAVIEKLKQKGIKITELTLHVGAGTFQPVKVVDANNHPMHSEYIAVELETLKQIQKKIGHILAIGTTSMRTLESLYFIGYKISQGEFINQFVIEQDDPYLREYNISTYDSLAYIIKYLESKNQKTIYAYTKILIKPGYKFHVVDMLITNFHQPKSTLLLLVSAFVGKDWEKIYQYALDNDFRFLSYGDSSLLFKNELVKYD